MKSIDNHLAQIDIRLQVWASWYTKMIESGLDYTSSPWDRIVQPKHCRKLQGYSPLEVNEKAEEIDAAIVHLWRLMPDLARALHSYYLTPGNGKQQAQTIGVSFSRFKERVRLAKIWLIAYLSAKEEIKHMQ